MTGWRPPLALLGSLAALLLWPEGPGDRGLRPDFLLLFALGAGLFGREGAGLVAGAVAGLLAAPFSLEPFGLDAALLATAGLAAGRVRVYLAAGHPGVQGALAAVAALLAGLVRLLLLEASGAPVASLGLLPALLAGVAATAAAAPVVLFLLDALHVFRVPEAGRPLLV